MLIIVLGFDLSLKRVSITLLTTLTLLLQLKPSTLIGKGQVMSLLNLSFTYFSHRGVIVLESVEFAQEPSKLYNTIICIVACLFFVLVDRYSRITRMIMVNCIILDNEIKFTCELTSSLLSL
jgi:hypothetical protein